MSVSARARGMRQLSGRRLDLVDVLFESVGDFGRMLFSLTVCPNIARSVPPDLARGSMVASRALVA